MLEATTRVVTLVVTNVIKLAGLYVGVRAATKVPVEAITMGWSAFAMAGAQLSETTILLLIERFFGQQGSSRRKERQ
jgi:hypothetical protein